jgi:hypothetical protein
VHHSQIHQTRVTAWLLARMLQTARGWKKRCVIFVGSICASAAGRMFEGSESVAWKCLWTDLSEPDWRCTRPHQHNRQGDQAGPRGPMVWNGKVGMLIVADSQPTSRSLACPIRLSKPFFGMKISVRLSVFTSKLHTKTRWMQ